MFVIDRTRSTLPSPPSETLSIAGTTGNIYTVTIAHVPSCTCPHALKGAQCKHILYALVRVLKAPPTLQYQLAFLTSELDTIFDSAPPLPAADASAAYSDGKRKPLDDDCPICCCPFEPESEEIVFCRAACGNNIHGACFAQWAASKKGSAVTCPFCRTPWQGDEKTLKQVSKSGRVNAEGYVNVAGQLGLSGRRDYSTYHSHWVARQRRAGLVDDADGDEY
ncbi:hypothetical protein B0A49_13467 [Cryomyces minteri]|uniref:RING-type domain-containing protein n=1 Tax=Cryomyces minteri TaxID=331657 RepID=A0A4U0VFJ7_9PEZI|nr:hypothetical protein B0A49_13467 [Cryomyces minteri]